MPGVNICSGLSETCEDHVSNHTLVSVTRLRTLVLNVSERETQRLASRHGLLEHNADGIDIVEVLHIVVLMGVFTALVTMHILLQAIQ